MDGEQQTTESTITTDPVLRRKRALRRPQRSVATRYINTLSDLIREEPQPDVIAQITLKKTKLLEKGNVIKELDSQILELTPDDELEEEIELSDDIQERIELTIMKVNRYLESLNMLTSEPTRLENSTTNNQDTLSDTGNNQDTSSTTGNNQDNPDASDCQDTINDQNSSSGALTQSEPIMSDSSICTPPTSDPPVSINPVSSRPPLERTTDDIPLTFPRTTAPGIKLPKLQPRKFNGDFTSWTTFWDVFESSIHLNPTLSNVDKFVYLKSLLESTASESISGLSLSSANYDEAISILQRRFGNKRIIISKHLEGLCSLEPVTSTHNTKALRHLYDIVESHVRGLKTIGISSESYGELLTSMLVNKLPHELRLIITRTLREDNWTLDSILTVFETEIVARERAAGSRTTKPYNPQRIPPTTNSFPTQTHTNCVFCNQSHDSSNCRAVKTVEERKRSLRASGRCFICLRRKHISKDCRSSLKCDHCSGRHHKSICTNKPDQSKPTPLTPNNQPTPIPPSTTTAYSCTEANTSILLQTATTDIYNPSNSSIFKEARILLDCGSQRTYITEQTRDILNLKPIRTETLIIKTFGGNQRTQQTCDIVEFSIITKKGHPVYFTSLVVPNICEPIYCQPISVTKDNYDHLLNLDLADSCVTGTNLEIDILIGSDYYWTLVTGRIIHNQDGPTAVETKLGWVLSGPTEFSHSPDTMVNFNSSHTLFTVCTLNSHAIHTQDVPMHTNDVTTHTQGIPACTHDVTLHSLDAELRNFWELESMGILPDEPSVYDTFKRFITFKDRQYVVKLPWKDNHPNLPTNYELCHKRLTGLLRRLHQNPDLFKEYHEIIQEQIKKKIVEYAPPTEETKTHYLPHHPVIRKDKLTSKVRIVYDASSKSDGPSLNDCLYKGPPFHQNILDILLRFRCHHVALIGDIEKAFLMVGVAEEDRDSLRFLWVKDPMTEPHEIIKLRFTRVVFGVTSSPFLLNATIDTHLKKYASIEPEFVNKISRSIYVDDVTTTFPDVNTAYDFYERSTKRLNEAGFKLRKFMTNSTELYSKLSCEETGNMSDDHKILGIRWNPQQDVLIFDVSNIIEEMNTISPTKRGVVSLGTKFYDPLGLISPIIICFKVLFQVLCEAKISWDEPLNDTLHERWLTLKTNFKELRPLVIPRPHKFTRNVTSYSLRGFCDASQQAYAAVVYLCASTPDNNLVSLLCSKTRVAPLKSLTIPRLELMSALLLSRLMTTVATAFKSEITLDEPLCYTDSEISLCWITREDKEWKQFVQNRVIEIRKLIPASYWRHCPGVQNPADLPSRGTTAKEFNQNLHLWLNGPSWLSSDDIPLTQETYINSDILSECLQEQKKNTLTLLIPETYSSLINYNNFGSLRRLINVFAYCYAFVRLLRYPSQERQLTLNDQSSAHNYVLRSSQSTLSNSRHFQIWRKQFNLYVDESGVWRSGGRFEHSKLPHETNNPIFLDRKHPLTTLIIKDCHERVNHSGVKITLTEFRSKYWVVQARQIIKAFIHKCVICRKAEGRPFYGPPLPPLPSFRITEAPPFTYTGLDFAGPLFVKDGQQARKVWLCLFTCCVVRGVHLDLVPDMTVSSFLNCFRRFTARRGFPEKLLSDNAKTFKSAETAISSILNSHLVKRYFLNLKIDWKFNVSRAPWWGGVFERMIQSAKRCIRKSIGNSKLTYDELLTVLAETEMILNSRPLSYITSNDIEEPLTPSHLMLGRRVMNLPDCSHDDDPADPSFEITTGNLNNRMKYLNTTMNQFWKRWRDEYLLELRETFRHSQRSNRGQKCEIKLGDVVLIYDENLPRSQWRLGTVEILYKGIDDEIRSASVRTLSRKGRVKRLRRPVQKLYPLEVRREFDISEIPPTNETTDNDATPQTETRPRRQAAQDARSRIYGMSLD